MPDVFNQEKRSVVMASIRGRGNIDTELAAITIFRRCKIIGWRRHRRIEIIAARRGAEASRRKRRYAVPDFIFPAERIAVFVDGCFWHACPLHFKAPGTNAEFWKQKIEGNKARDKEFTLSLRKQGWSVLRIWEHDVQKAPTKVAARILRVLRKARAE